MAVSFRSDHRLAGILKNQSAVATRSQLVAQGVGYEELRAHLNAARWSAWGDHVIVLHNSEPGRRQLMWAATLDAGPGAALCSHTALELAGFKPFGIEAAGIHLLVPRGAKVTERRALMIHESRRVHPQTHIKIDGLPCTPAARSAIDAAAWQRWPRFACALLAAVVQQKICTPDDLDSALAGVGRVRHKAYLREAIRTSRVDRKRSVRSISYDCATATVWNVRSGRSNGVTGMGAGAILTPSGNSVTGGGSSSRSTAVTTWTLCNGRTICDENGVP